MIAPQILEPSQPIISVGTMEILSLLAEIYTKSDLPLSLQFNIQVAIFFHADILVLLAYLLYYTMYVFMNVGPV